MTDAPTRPDADWRNRGIRRIRASERSSDTPETMGMNREVAISGARTGSSALWAGTNRIMPNSMTGPHHHGPLESVIYVISGTAHMRWGDRLEFITEAKAGDFFLVPALRAAPGDQRFIHGGSALRAGAQRNGGGGGEPARPGAGRDAGVDRARLGAPP
jgi:uncharacterized RmlC-like cupin family protein